MTREQLAMYCAPIFSVAVALRADIATPHFPSSIEGYVAWALTGLIAGLAPIIAAGAASIYNRSNSNSGV